jgi:hypothetical protein
VRLAGAVGAVGVVIALAVTFAVRTGEHRDHTVRPHSSRLDTTLPVKAESYIGVYESGAPSSYAGVTRFTAKTGIKPRLVVYYSGWFEPFKAAFATTVAEHGAVPLIQINPTDINMASIASGKYDGYLSSYAEAVRSYRLRPRDERELVLLGLPAHFTQDVRGRLAAHRDAVPRASGPKRDLALDTQRRAPGRQHFPSSTLVARE